jgi:predicted small lipoprotein YifL
MTLALRTLAALVSLGLAVSSLAGCGRNEPPNLPRSASPSSSASPTPHPAFTGNLNTLLVDFPSSAAYRLVNDGRITARRAAEMITLVDRDVVAGRLTGLGFVNGAYRGWTSSGTTVEILLMQYLDEAGADGCVAYLVEMTGSTGTPIDGIDKGRWMMDAGARRMQMFFRRGGIAVRILATATTTGLDATKYLSLAPEQYAELPAP